MIVLKTQSGANHSERGARPFRAGAGARRLFFRPTSWSAVPRRRRRRRTAGPWNRTHIRPTSAPAANGTCRSRGNDSPLAVGKRRGSLCSRGSAAIDEPDLGSRFSCGDTPLSPLIILEDHGWAGMSSRRNRASRNGTSLKLWVNCENWGGTSAREPTCSASAEAASASGPGVWCRVSDSNGRPTDYKSVALPAELTRPLPQMAKKRRQVHPCRPLP